MEEQKVTISIRISKADLDHLKRLSHEKSLKKGRELKYTDLIRDSIHDYLEIMNEKEISG